MLTAISAAIVVQWIVIGALSLLVMALFRQMGMLHERLGPVGALSLTGGPKVGDAAPAFDLPSLGGGLVSIGRPEATGKRTLLFFIAPGCPVCKQILPILRSVVGTEPDVRLVLASDGDEPAQRALVTRERLQDYPFVLSTDLGLAHQVSKLPYAVMIGANGRILAKGLVNNREHVESLFEAADRGVGSLQDYVKQQAATPVSA